MIGNKRAAGLSNNKLNSKRILLAIDVRLGKLCYSVYGEKIANSRFFRDEKKILVKAQFKRDKLSKASILRRKATKVVEMTHERIANGWIANAISSQKR